MRIFETLMVITILFSSCSNTCSSNGAINNDLLNIVQIIHEKKDFFFNKDGDKRYSFRTVVLRRDKFERGHESDFFQNEATLLSLLEKNNIDLFYVFSRDEIWFRICEKKSWFNIWHGFVGYVITLDKDNLKLSSFKPYEVEKLKENWYWAQIKFSIVN